jgi:hypothetical protein
MSRIKKEYSYKSKAHIWRIIPAGNDLLIIEERDVQKKEAFFTCFKISSGKIILKRFQLDEKFWIGIEDAAKGIIFFHKFFKPDLPYHTGIIAFDIASAEILWEDENYNFLFLNEDKLYSYQTYFEGRKFFILNSNTGELIEDLGDNAAEVNKIREGQTKNSFYDAFFFPRKFSSVSNDETALVKIIKKVKEAELVTGSIDYIISNGLLLLSFHTVNDDGSLKNKFKAIDIEHEKVIFEETLNSTARAIVPDSFFVIDDRLFLLKEKSILLVCSIKHD